ncbi:MAG: C39 family peptidase [Nitrososphaerales archaeon]|nr:C39 family peptidase [Nitrososphaerales archaeon]
MPDIDVPLVSQGDDDVGCVPACVKMVIEFYSAIYPDLPNPHMDALKKAMGYDDSGTSLDGVTGVNRILVGGAHRLEFDWRDFAVFDDIKGELEGGRPVIAWMKPNRALELSHSVVIKATTDDDLRVKVNDPEPDDPKSEYTTSEFMKQWENSDRILIRAKVTERPQQRELGDYA